MQTHRTKSPRRPMTFPPATLQSSTAAAAAAAPLSLSTAERTPSCSSASVEEDEQVLKWQQSGALRDIIGSQSVLSQELSQDTTPVFFESQLSATAAALQYGILTQEDPDTTALENSIDEQEEKDAGMDEVKKSNGNELVVENPTVATAVNPPPLQNSHHSIHADLSQDTVRLCNMANLHSLLDAVDMLNDHQHARRCAIQSRSETIQKTSDLDATSVVASSQSNAQNAASASTTNRQSNRISAKRKRAPIGDGHADDVGEPVLTPNDEAKKKGPLIAKRQPKAAPAKNSAIKSEEPVNAPDPKPRPSKTASSTASTSPTRQARPNQPEQAVARRAAELAERACHDAKLAKQLLMSMTLSRENPRGERTQIPPRGHIIPDGFHWATYPPLEKLLKERMEEYYQRSTSQRQSTQQQTFNNQLVVLVRGEAVRQGWSFEAVYDDEKALRDRIRCYYKTHIQNSKKRLNTMLRNPTKRSNAIHLMQHYALITSTLDASANRHRNINNGNDLGINQDDDDHDDDEDDETSSAGKNSSET